MRIAGRFFRYTAAGFVSENIQNSQNIIAHSVKSVL